MVSMSDDADALLAAKPLDMVDIMKPEPLRARSANSGEETTLPRVREIRE
jgi:hypothetical protein